jgi:hypothetical protein
MGQSLGVEHVERHVMQPVAHVPERAPAIAATVLCSEPEIVRDARKIPPEIVLELIQGQPPAIGRALEVVFPRVAGFLHEPIALAHLPPPRLVPEPASMAGRHLGPAFRVARAA